MTLSGSHDGKPVLPLLRFLNADAGFGRPAKETRPRHAFPAAETARAIPAGGRETPQARLLREWRPILARAGVSEALARHAAERAATSGTRFAEELLASGEVAEADLYRAIAADLGLGFADAVDPESVMADQARRLASLRDGHGLRIAMLGNADGTTTHLIADPGIDPAAIRALLAGTPHLRAGIRIAPPSALRAAIVERSTGRLLFDAQHRLLLQSPEFSARTVVSAWQGATAVAAVFAFLVLLWLAPVATTLAAHLIASAGFAACVVLRLLAWVEAGRLRPRPLPPADPARQPVYSVLVALYREKEMVPQLLAALGRLQWPRARLEIKLVCEADDDETLAALRGYRLPPAMEIVLVPPGLPRTKPKALAYALPLCSGEFVTLYDAEDRPDPLQLVEAWQRFCEEPPEVACLQAPLAVANGGASALSTMFSFEYAALFRGLLPWLARRRLALPLGGTSNHFRRAALDEVGGWDAYNVTEDAELGVRLARYGYRTGVITRPTWEDAPETLAVWLPQRIRWFKGWMQTWLVHMREPASLWRDLGPASFLAVQITSLGMIVSALFHPVFVGSILYGVAKLAMAGEFAPGDAAIGAVALGNVVIGYAAFIALGLVTLSGIEKPRPLVFVALTPVYWLLLSLAAWAALWEIYRRPHHWSKTPHRRASRPAAPGR